MESSEKFWRLYLQACYSDGGYFNLRPYLCGGDGSKFEIWAEIDGRKIIGRPQIVKLALQASSIDGKHLHSLPQDGGSHIRGKK